MATPSGRGGRVVGNYMLDRQIGTGSFSTVWRARDRARGTLVAVKEIVLERLSTKLQDNLLSEVSILRRISHPNIIALYDYIKAPGRIYLVLEYCSGGDLSVYIQKHGRVVEATAKLFMRQLATGLQVLRDNNVIHRDLKPQNLLLSTNDDNAVLKIADFGFARSLQPQVLAETLCGSPLYMAPEVMHFQKYDAKADLWSVGVILYQLVTGKTPFSGNSQQQLLQNIKSKELNFPSNHNLSRDCIDLCQKLLRRNAVERMTFEEFFNHQFLSEQPEVAISSKLMSSTRSRFPSFGSFEGKPARTSFNEDCLPFPLDDESIGQDMDQCFPMSKSSMKISDKMEPSGDRHDSGRSPGENRKDIGFANNQKPANVSMKDASIVDSLELVDQEYVIVPGPPLDMSSSPVSASRPHNFPSKPESSKLTSPKFTALSAPMPIVGAVVNSKTHPIGSTDSRSSPVSGTSHGSMDLVDIEQPSSDFITRIKSLQLGAAVLTELVKDKVVNGKHLEAFSIQLVVLAIWKQALHVCHAQLAPGIEESTYRGLARKVNGDSSSIAEFTCCTDSELPDAICSQVEKEFLLGVGHAEELAVDVDRMGGATEMPDAIEIIFQSALTSGRQGAVDEMMGNSIRASTWYTKAVCLLDFLLVEAPSLALNPPFALTNSDRHRLRMYIDVISNRQGRSRFQGMGIKCDDQMTPSST